MCLMLSIGVLGVFVVVVFEVVGLCVGVFCVVGFGVGVVVVMGFSFF